MTKNSVINYTLVVLALLAALTVLNPALAQSANPFTLFGFGASVDTNTGATSANTLRVLANQGAAGASAWPISAASLPLPTGAAADASLTTIDTDLKANITLHSGAALIGKVGIDQTTPGTTNLVATTVADGANSTLGAQADAAIVTSATGTVSGKLRGIVSLLVSGITVATHAVTQSGNWTARVVGNAGAIFDAATGAAPPANALFIGGLTSGATGGLVTGITVCDSGFDIDINTATTTLVVTGVASRKVRICSFNMVATAADTVAWIEGTGATCGTGTAGMIGSSTAAHGQAFAANGGIAVGSGLGEVLTAATAGDSVCLVTSAATQLDGHIKYAIY